MSTYRFPLFLLLMCLFNLACSTSSRNISSNPVEKTAAEADENQEVVYLIYENGGFAEGTLDRKVEPLGGEKRFYSLAYSQMKYPPKAREKGVQGTVWISVVVNELGTMEEVMIKEGIGAGCDEEALKCIKMAGAIGFEPPMKEGKPVKVKFDIPAKFSLK